MSQSLDQPAPEIRVPIDRLTLAMVSAILRTLGVRPAAIQIRVPTEAERQTLLSALTERLQPINDATIAALKRAVLPDALLAQEHECAICKEVFLASDVAVFMPCNEKHCFHEQCVVPWLRESNATCPICRVELPIVCTCSQCSRRNQAANTIQASLPQQQQPPPPGDDDEQKRTADEAAAEPRRSKRRRR